MLMPSIFTEDLFDDFFDFPDFDKMEHQMDKKLYGRHAKNVMKADVKEKANVAGRKDLLRRSKPLHIFSFHTQNLISHPLCQLQLMKGHNDRQALFSGKFLQHRQKFELILHIQK